jgi:glutamate N-acetyltransferase/amino-acid N-acetyltransferase
VTLPAGFRHVHTPDRYLLINDGPKDTAAGLLDGEDAPLLWSRQVLTYGQLRAVVVTPAVEGSEPERFLAVHGTAEHVAEELGIGAVEVAVCWEDAMQTRQAVRLTSAGWSVAGVGTAGRLVLLVTDAVIESAVLRAVLTKVWPATETVLVLASGAAGSAPDMTEFGVTLSALRVDLACPKGIGR